MADDLTRLIDTANAPIFGVDSEGRVTVWNRKAAQITGYSTEDTMGKDLVTCFIRQENRASVHAVLQKALDGEDTDNFELPLFTEAGKRVEVLLNATARRDERGSVVGMVAVEVGLAVLTGGASGAKTAVTAGAKALKTLTQLVPKLAKLLPKLKTDLVP